MESRELTSTDGEGSPTVTQRTDTNALFIGPLPSPGMLQRYEAIEPGFAGRIAKMAEDEMEHRHTMERAHHGGDHKLALRSQVFGLVVLLTTLGTGAALAATGNLLAGYTMLVTSVLGSLGAAFRGRAAAIDAARQLPPGQPTPQPQQRQPNQKKPPGKRR